MFAQATSTIQVENLGVSHRENPDVDIAALINAAWSILIWQYTGLENTRFITATTSGETDHLESTYQLCSTQLDSATTISDFIQQIQQSTQELASDQLPLAPSRNEAATSPFLQSITTLTSNKTYLKFSPNHLDATGALIELVAIPLPFDKLEFVVRFAPSAIDQERADHLAAAFAHILNLIKRPDRHYDRLNAVDLVSDYDKAKLWTWNSVQLPETVESCVHFLFRQRAREEPDMLAVDAWDGRFTYGELDAISDRLAVWLAQEEGIRPESIVPLCFEKSRWAIAALLGVIKAGGAIVFIDPANPVSRRQDIMDQIEGKWVLSSKSQAETWEKEMGVRTIVVDEKFVASLPVEDHILESGVTPNNLLYLIFTSGSTGKPKGCLIPHKAFISGALEHAAKSNLARGSRVLQLASYSFDVSMLEIMTSLISGACVCTPDMASMAQGLHPIFDKFAITWAFLTPSLVKLLRPEMVPKLKTLALGGEPLTKIDIETWAPHLQLINGYGPSECSVAAAGDPHLKPTSDPSNIGRGVGGICWIVDAENHDRLVPLGAVGELLISGPLLARGYLNDAEKTAASFIENPTWTEGWALNYETASSASAYTRFYKTGDLARFNLDGTIQILGRKDTQVKLRGLRVELGEIEHNIARHPYVKHAAAFLPKTGRCQEKIVTVVCLRDFAHDSKPGRSDAPIDVIFEDDRPGVKDQADAVRNHLRDCVPEYMVPAVWIVIEAWPLLVSAKLDRKRVFNWLLDMDEGLYNRLLGFLGDDSSENGSSEKGVADLPEIERTLRDIFAHALNTPAQNLPLDKSFIALGGDSLAAMRVIAQCKRVGLSVAITDMMKSKGIKDLAARLEKSSGLKPKQDALDASFPLSRAQQLCLGDGKTANHLTQSILLNLDATVSAARVKAALEAIVTRHSMLRARFGEVEEAGTVSLRQTVASEIEGSYRFQHHRIERPEDIATIASTADAVSLSGPVFSAHLITGNEKQLLLLRAHSAVVDAVSWRIIIRQLQTCLSLADGPLLGDEVQEPVSFQNWVDIEKESSGVEHAVAPRILTASEVDIDYQAWEIDQVTATLLLSETVHRPLRTHAVDFMMASLMLSFSQTFGDRDTLPTLALWEDKRGRASEDFGIDLSQTVGQFETLRVLNLNTDDVTNDIEDVQMLKGAKDARQLRTESNTGIQTTEISFRYQDLSNVVDSPDSLVQIEPRPVFLRSAGVGPSISNISIVAKVIDGRIQLGFSFNKKVVEANHVRAWIATAKQTLASLAVKMINAPAEYTLSDFPLLRGISYNGLDKLINEQLPQIGVISRPESSLIEDIYPCSPMQQDLLLSQHRANGDTYDVYHIAELRPRDPTKSVSIERLAQSWAEVVKRHTSLRTIFVESTNGDAQFNQVVLARTQPSVSIVDCDSPADDFALVLANQDPISIKGPEPAHRLSICRIAGANHVVIKLEINHAIVDGVSAAVIIRDLLQAYDGHAAEWEPALPFRDYISHIRQTPLAASVDFWAQYLKGQSSTMVPRLASLETDNQGAQDERQLNVVSVPLEEERVSNEALFDFCRKASVTPASVFQAAWALVLRVYAESPEEVCFGYLSAGRDAPIPGIEEGVGAFLTMLVSRLSFATQEKQDKGRTLLDAVQLVADDYVEALPHQHVGLSNIQHALKTGGSPLFNTIVTVNRDVDSPAESSLIFKNIGDHEPDEYAIVLDVQLNGSNTSRASLRHWTDHLTATQAKTIASALGSAVNAIITRPDTLISEVDLVGAAHKEQLLSFNTHPLPRANRLIFTKFEELARVKPDAPAVCAWDGEWTYGQLDEVSNRLAHYLRTLGVGPEAVVPHCFPKSGWTIVTCLAILKAGGAFVGLDPTHPRKRLEGLVQEAGANVVCVAPQNQHLFEGCENLSIVAITPEFVAELPSKAGPACASIQPNNTACVVFTSGTTGRPKAVVVEHASMATLADLMGPAVRIGPEARVFQFASYTFDTSNQDIFTTLQRGGCVCVPSDEDRVNDIPGALNRLRANHAHLTSTVISLMRPEQVPQLRWLFSAGEPLTRENVEIWAPAVELYNSYGPAESSVAVTCTPTRLSVNGSPANIGQAFGSWAWIVDPSDHHKLMPLGAVGELLLEGPLLARHYLNNAAQTAAAFVEDPRWAKNMTPDRIRRFYRTGDLCRFNRDGSLTIIGRRDTQIKIHGQRVELDHIKYEVQAQLAQLGQSSLVSVDAVVLPNTQTQDRTLIAFVQFLDESTASKSPDTLSTPMTETLARLFSDLQRALKTSLPQYMVPAMFVPITQIPRTANGKLARNVLRETIAALSESDVARYMLQGDVTKKAPTTPRELKLQAAWSKVLNLPLEKVGASDDFFQLGGDSVVAMRLAGAARVAGMSLTFADIFAHPVLSDMAKIVRTADEEEEQATDEEAFDLLPISSNSTLQKVRGEAATQCGVRPEAIVDLYPCTPLQEGLIALSMRKTGAYKDQRILRLKDQTYDVSKFRRALETVVAAEPILRTRFVSVSGAGLLQAVLNVPVDWVKHDNLTAYLEEDLNAPVTYGSSLIRLAQIEEENGERYIVWSGHHALCDGFSMDITFEQIAHAMSHEGSVVPKPVSFKGFIRFLLDQDRDSSASEYWQKQFPANGEAPPQFPPRPQGHQVVPHRACRLQFQLNRPAGSKISVTNYLRAAWGLVVARHMGSSDVLFGVTLSGRNAPVAGISTMNGPTMTTTPFRMAVPLDSETTVAQYLESLHEQAAAMMPFEHTGLQNIRRLNEQARLAIDNMGHRFAVEPSITDVSEALDGMEIVSAELPEGFYTDALVIRNYDHSDGTIDVEARYDHTLIADQDMQRLLSQYNHVVQQLLSQPETCIRDIQVLSPEDIGEIMEWNGDLPETVQQCVHQLVAERTKERPDAEAVCAWDGSYTFMELDAVTERLAAHLQSLGVGPEVTVALCFDKSKWNVVSMLSVLKAGGCYTALSPAYPAARMQDILQDVQSPLVLCSPQHADKFTGMAPKVLPIDDASVKSLPKQTTTHRVTSAVQPSNAALIVFTSGSTGKPKGAIIEHRGLCSMQHYEGPHVEMGPDTRTLQFASHVFDVSNSEVFTTLMRGGCVCVPSETERLSDLAGAVNKYRVNWSFHVPTTAETLDPEQMPGLKHLALGGEAISQGLCDRWASRVTLLNSYGPSECSIWTSVSHLQPGTTSPNNIGRGLGCRTWITDANDHNRLVAIGCVGELCVEGPIVTRGYKANPEQTAAAYIENPEFARALGIQTMRIYKTGDLVKYDADGTILYVGRKDSQIKVRGQRIELSEVEQNIVAHGIDADAVVVEKIFLDSNKDRVALAAFLRLTTAAEPIDGDSDVENLDIVRDQLVALKRHLLETIPPHMVPSFFIPLRSMPVTQTGKKNRKALQALGASLSSEERQQYTLDNEADSSNTDGGRACTSEAEMQLRGLWSEVLGIFPEESISANDNFFHRGGDSIQAMRLAAAARRAGKALAVSDLFRMPRLYQMAELWESSESDMQSQDAIIAPFSLLQPDTVDDAIEDAARQCNVEASDVEDIYLCSPLQEGLMAVSTRKQGSYISTRIFNLPADLDINRFKAAWQKAADVFPILRTRIILGRASESLQIVVREKLTWQTITDETSFALPVIEYGGRLCSFAIDVEARKFVLALHHAVYDGWSATVLLGAVEKFYLGEQYSVGPGYNVFIRHLSQVDQSESDAFWRDQLSGTPSHFPKLPSKTYEAKNSANVSHTIRLPPPENQPTGILKSTLLRAAWALVSSRHAGSNDITFGQAQSGRDCAVPGIVEVVGPTVTTVPVRIQINDDESIVSFLERVQEQSVSMIPHQHAGVQTLRQLGKEVQPALDFTTLFEFGEDSTQSGFITEVEMPELLDGFWSYPIVFECHLAENGETVNVLARHDPTVIPTHQMNWICKQFEHVVDQLYRLTSDGLDGGKL
ncbi:nonribosomal peptide synthase, partial [Aspergillus brasiliensis]